MYPSTESALNGKLRLTYECSPLAFIIEQAGGKAISENGRIMEIGKPLQWLIYLIVAIDGVKLRLDLGMIRDVCIQAS